MDIPGASAWAMRRALKGSPSVRNRSPRAQASRILRAARSALIDAIGRAAPRENQDTSRARWPLNSAFTKDPVRIIPGRTVVTRTPSGASSTASPSEKPTMANLEQVYGSRWGTGIAPPIEVTFTIRASADRRRCGSAASVVCTAPQKFTPMTDR